MADDVTPRKLAGQISASVAAILTHFHSSSSGEDGIRKQIFQARVIVDIFNHLARDIDYYHENSNKYDQAEINIDDVRGSVLKELGAVTKLISAFLDDNMRQRRTVNNPPTRGKAVAWDSDEEIQQILRVCVNEAVDGLKESVDALARDIMGRDRFDEAFPKDEKWSKTSTAGSWEDDTPYDASHSGYALFANVAQAIAEAAQRLRELLDRFPNQQLSTTSRTAASSLQPGDRRPGRGTGS